MVLMVIDENLIRNELTPEEKAEHIAVKVDILTNRDLASASARKTIRKTAQSAEKQITVSKAEQVKREQRATETKAKKGSKKHVADSLEHSDSSHVSAAIKDDKVLKAAELDVDVDVDKLDELTASHFKEVAKTALTDADEAKVRLDNIVKAKKLSDKTSAQLF